MQLINLFYGFRVNVVTIYRPALPGRRGDNHVRRKPERLPGKHS
ncbi:hypothetical protein DCCM_1027 [Desulfocucumis palustris]|uniref:Uncharacterized protein n=1 Tax=Desulfocucumis palustris TaxID=1898651 RepID=A0A2L2XG22_9FIRM|nr:hypothetical protein DCCM_1027 [Desulfocucumis palustris]